MNSTQEKFSEILSGACSAGIFPGAIAISLDRQSICAVSACGFANTATDLPMAAATVLWIASATKPVTTCAALQLVEAGSLSLDGDAADLIPELREVVVLDGFDASGKPRLRPCRRSITLHHLLTHTAGFCYDIWQEDIARYIALYEIPGTMSGLKASLSLPVAFEPGTAWQYGISIDYVGQLIEAASGKRLDHYVHDHILAPLGMTDTGFVIRDDWRPRLAAVHVRGADGSFEPIELEMPSAPEQFMGGHGLYSTASDYARFLRMLLNEGEIEGVRILEPETVRSMFQSQCGALPIRRLPTFNPDLAADLGIYPEQEQLWGFGFMLNASPMPCGLNPNSGSWAGLANDFFWVDPTAGTAGLLFAQCFPFATEAMFSIVRGIQQATYTNRA